MPGFIFLLVSWVSPPLFGDYPPLFPNELVKVGDNPVSIVVGDFYRDGNPDIASANSNSDDVSILLGFGDGSFFPEFRFPAGDGPRYIDTGDFNGDLIQDLAVANELSDDVSVLLGNGDGSFQFQIRTQAGDGPFSLGVGNFDDDGDPDLAVVNRAANTVSIHLGQGNGTFQPGVILAIEDDARSIEVRDLNQDGLSDLAVANQGTDSLLVFLATGGGAFAPPDRYEFGSSVSAVDSGDFNEDTFVDLAVSGSPGNILLGDGSGGFPVVMNTAGLTSRPFTIEDMDTDGHLDFVVDGSRISLGSGDGQFPDQVPMIAGGELIISLDTGDFNGDGWPDVAAAALHADAVAVVLGEQGTTFGPTRLADSEAIVAAIDDFTNDGNPDLVFQKRDDLSVLPGNGDGTFGAEFLSERGRDLNSITIADFNRDGRPDLAGTLGPYFSSTTDTEIAVRIASGNGTFFEERRYETGKGPLSAQSADFNMDENPDLAWVNRFSNDVAVLLGHGDGNFGQQIRFGVGASPLALAVGLFNGDSIPDLAVVNGNRVSVFLGTGDGGFNLRTHLSVRGDLNGIVTADFNRDGSQDIAVALSGGSFGVAEISVLLGFGDGSFFPPVKYFAGLTGSGQVHLVQGDFNADDTIDLAVLEGWRSGNYAVLPGWGDGRFDPPIHFGIGEYTFPTWFAAGDLDRDGRRDLVVVAESQRFLALAMNQGPFPVLTVPVDIQPGNPNNQVNPESSGVTQVAILSFESFDATTVNPATVQVSGAGVKIPGGNGRYLCRQDDPNQDGLADLVCKVLTIDLVLDAGSDVLVLEAETFDGTRIRGEDTFTLVPGK